MHKFSQWIKPVMEIFIFANVLSVSSHLAPTNQSWLKSVSKDESLVIKVQARHINIKTFIFPPFKKLGLLPFQCQTISKMYFSSAFAVGFQPLIYPVSDFFVLIAETSGWGQGFKVEMNSLAKARKVRVPRWPVWPSHAPLHTELPPSTDDTEILYRMYVKLCMWKSLAQGDVTHKTRLFTATDGDGESDALYIMSFLGPVISASAELAESLKPNLPKATTLPLFNGYWALVMQLSQQNTFLFSLT